jgi:hypothetical protein
MDRQAPVFDELRQLDPTHPDYLRAQLLVAWHDGDQLTERYILRLLLNQLGPEATATTVG